MNTQPDIMTIIGAEKWVCGYCTRHTITFYYRALPYCYCDCNCPLGPNLKFNTWLR